MNLPLFLSIDSMKEDLMSPGIYKVKVVDVRETLSSNGIETVIVKMEILEGKYSGRLIYDRFYCTDRAIVRLKNFLEAIGINSNDFIMTEHLLLGKICNVNLYINRYQEKLSNRVAFMGYSKSKTFQLFNNDDCDFEDTPF